VPNHNWLRWINAEANTHVRWKHGTQRRVFFKEAVESRFHAFGLRWVYTSTDCFNNYLGVATRKHRSPLDVRAYVLAASRDGYWYGKPPEALQRTLDKYLVKSDVLLRPTSHLWVATPDHFTAFLERVPAAT